MLVSGQALGARFELRRRLGAGGMGEVFEAWDRQRDERVALKTLARVDPETLSRFKREFRTLQGLAHPNLVSLRELIREDDRWFFTMELVSGVHLVEHVRPRGPRAAYDEARVRDSFAQLARGLRALHHAGKVHRDVKPSNVMVTGDGRVVLLDFGLVTEIDPGRQSLDGRPVGTVDYMAPEQASGKPITEAADWYGFGIMLYEVLSSRVPYTGHVLQILVEKQERPAAPIAEIAPGTPPDLAALCDDLLAIEPSRRPTGADVAARLGVADERHRTSSVGPVDAADLPFVGRDAELAALAASWERAGAAAVVHLVTGESGMGKTTLVRRFVDRLAAADRTVLALQARCYQRESVPYKALDGIADGLAHHLARLPDDEVAAVLPRKPSILPRLFPVFQQVGPIAAAPGVVESKDPSEQRSRMFQTLRHLFAGVARVHRMILAIDDLQWADADSYLLLRELLRGATPPPILVIATVRTSDGEVAAAVQDGLAGLDVTTSALGPLDDRDSRRIAIELAPRVGGRADLDRLMHEAGGHPLFLHELVRYADSVGAMATTPTLDDALWSRVEVLGDDARRLLELTCVAGGPITSDLAIRATRLDSTTLGRATASLRVATLCREVPRGRGLALEPYHDRVREAVQSRLAPEYERGLHARLAAALEASTDRDPHLLHRHYRMAGQLDRAAAYAEIAAQRSVDAHAFEQAAELWRAVVELVDHDETDLRRLRLRLGEALSAAGRGAEAADHYLAAAAGADPATRLECHRHAAQQLLYSGRIERGMTVLGELLGQIGVAVATTPRKALLSLLYHRGLLRLRGFGYRPRHRRQIDDATLMKIEALHGAAIGLAAVDSIRGADYQARGLLLALRTGSRFAIARGMVFEGMFLSTNGQHARGRRMFELARAAADGQGDPYLDAIVEAGPGVLDYFEGNLESAVGLLTSSSAKIQQLPGVVWELVSTRIFVLWALRFIGDYHRLRERVDLYLFDAELRGDQYFESTIRRSCMPLVFAADRPDLVASELARATWVPPDDSFHVQHFHEWVAIGEHALYTAGPPPPRFAEMRAALIRSLLFRVVTIRVQAAYLEGRLALADADLADAPAVARRNAAILRRSPQRVASVWAALLTAGAAARAGDTAAARAELATAEREARGLGMKAWAAAAAYRAAYLDGSLAARTAATAELHELGVVAPHRMARLLAPGFT